MGQKANPIGNRLGIIADGSPTGMAIEKILPVN